MPLLPWTFASFLFAATLSRGRIAGQHADWAVLFQLVNAVLAVYKPAISHADKALLVLADFQASHRWAGPEWPILTFAAVKPVKE